MDTKTLAFKQQVEEQIAHWNRLRAKPKHGEVKVYPVITISREPGAGGTTIARKLSETLGMDFISIQIIQKVAQSAQMSERLVASLDEKDVTLREDWVRRLFGSQHLWPDRFLRHLTKVINIVALHGNAVILGRGANFILPPEETFRIRLIAPLEARIAMVMTARGSSRKSAEKYVFRTDFNRKAFIRKYFGADITDPAHFDLVVDTSRLGIDGTVATINHAFKAWQHPGKLR
ncbi:cytidylate kinase-like family protein [bacterium]|nr:MAG: cytidylate kinase-like family protein [bacterium]